MAIPEVVINNVLSPTYWLMLNFEAVNTILLC
nr:MAG TPA: hypothetical protein [Caudoviricetes sp.]